MNVARDYANNVDLKLAGWRVIRIWECEIRTKAKREDALQQLYASITQPSDIGHYQFIEIDNRSIAAEPNIRYGELKTLLQGKDNIVIIFAISDSQNVNNHVNIV